jgi:heme-degrading monooxygenase HmoA
MEQLIARTWHGRVRAEQADEYYQYLLKTGLSDYRSTPGNRGLLVLRHVEGDVAHFTLITLWESMEAIRRFAGEDGSRARYYPEDDDFLLEQEPGVTHAAILLADLPQH